MTYTNSSSFVRPTGPGVTGTDLSARIGPHGRWVNDLPEKPLMGITNLSSDVTDGDMFAALPGMRQHGARFAAAAVADGARAVFTDPDGAQQLLELGVPLLVSDTPLRDLGKLSAAIYADPAQSLRIFGVTGTNGKTTTTYLWEAALRHAGLTTGRIGTIGIDVAGQALTTSHTTPQAPHLQALLAHMRDCGVTDVTMEVSSHALAQERVGGIEFEVGAFANLSQDHLDFHRNMDEYFATKRKLFDGRSRRMVTMIDDEWSARLVSESMITVSANMSDKSAQWQVDSVRDEGLTQLFHFTGPNNQSATGKVAIAGRFNVSNAMLAIVSLVEAGIALDVAVAGVAACTGVPGRMETIEVPDVPIHAVVDYAHTPASVSEVLKALRPVTSGRLICVVGCGGDRDAAKRPLMGQAAALGADIVIVTDDNPRSEDPSAIRAAVMAGIAQLPALSAQVDNVGDRRLAIEHAVELAEPGDVIAVVGKGHEPGQEIAGMVHPHDDRDYVRQVLATKQ